MTRYRFVFAVLLDKSHHRDTIRRRKLRDPGLRSNNDAKTTQNTKKMFRDVTKKKKKTKRGARNNALATIVHGQPGVPKMHAQSPPPPMLPTHVSATKSNATSKTNDSTRS